MNKAFWKRLLIGKLNRKRVLVDLIVVPILAYAGITVAARWQSERMLFVPQPPTYDDLPGLLTLTAEDGIEVSALYLDNPKADHTLLFSHGNAEDLGDVSPWLEYLHSLGFSVFCYDYRGYGRSAGRASEAGANRDILAAYTYLTENLGKAPESIIAYGFSVGGGPSVRLAARVPLGGLILQSTFVSAYRVMTRFPVIPFDRFPSEATLRKVRCPVLVIHGTEDRVIPFWHGEALYRKANDPKRKLWLEGVGHNDIPGPHEELFATTLKSFADSIMTRKQHAPIQ